MAGGVGGGVEWTLAKQMHQKTGARIRMGEIGYVHEYETHAVGE